MEYLQQASEILGHLTTAILSFYAISLIIPGEQPDKFLKKCLDISNKISRKKK